MMFVLSFEKDKKRSKPTFYVAGFAQLGERRSTGLDGARPF